MSTSPASTTKTATPKFVSNEVLLNSRPTAEDSQQYDYGIDSSTFHNNNNNETTTKPTTITMPNNNNNNNNSSSSTTTVINIPSSNQQQQQRPPQQPMSAKFQAQNNHFTDEEMAKHIRVKTSLIIAIAFCCVFMVVELVSGIIAHSLAIMTDAAHMLTDVGSLALSLFAVIASQWEASDQFTFGFKRAEVVGALFSIMLVWGLVGAIIFEGIDRLNKIVQCAKGTQDQFTECEGTEPRLMLIVGTLGLVVNIGYAVILAWGGAEVKHAHSHGGDGDDDDHGHSHGGHGHAHGGSNKKRKSEDHGAGEKCSGGDDHHGHAHGGGEAGGEHHGGEGEEEEFYLEKVKCCEPSKEEMECADKKCDHSNLKKKPQPREDHHGHSHDHSGDDHGHSHGDDHGHSHGDEHHHDDHGHSHAAAESSSHGHSHGDDNNNNKKDEHHHDDDEEEHETMNLNIKGAAMHALGDCLQSIGVIIAAGIIWAGCGVGGNPHSYYNIADPLCSLLFAVITLWTTKSLFVEVFGILMERAPRGVHVSCIKRKFEHFDVVVEVKDIFIWSITNDRTALGAHLVMCREATANEIFSTLDKIRTLCTQLGFSVSAVEVLRQGDESTLLLPSNLSPAPSPQSSPQITFSLPPPSTACKNPKHDHGNNNNNNRQENN